MSKNNQDFTPTFKLTERATLAACVVVIAAAFALMGVFFMFSWIFFLIFITDLILLVSGRMSDAIKRFTLSISVMGAAMALIFVVASHPWLFR